MQTTDYALCRQYFNQKKIFFAAARKNMKNSHSKRSNLQAMQKTLPA
jgi:hypothetical protein